MTNDYVLFLECVPGWHSSCFCNCINTKIKSSAQLSSPSDKHTSAMLAVALRKARAPIVCASLSRRLWVWLWSSTSARFRSGRVIYVEKLTTSTDRDVWRNCRPASPEPPPRVQGTVRVGVAFWERGCSETKRLSVGVKRNWIPPNSPCNEFAYLYCVKIDAWQRQIITKKNR